MIKSDVGYSEDTFTPSEFEITSYLKEGSNRLAVEVFRRSSASWLENQDFWRFSGIFRELKTCGLWNQEDILLFTEDLLNIRDSLNSIYAPTDDGKQNWYRLPENYYNADRNRRGA